MATVQRGRPPKEKKVEQPEKVTPETVPQEQPKAIEEAPPPVVQDTTPKKVEPVIKVLAPRAMPKLSQPNQQPVASGNVLVYDSKTGKSVSMARGYALQFVKHNKTCTIKS